MRNPSHQHSCLDVYYCVTHFTEYICDPPTWQNKVLFIFKWVNMKCTAFLGLGLRCECHGLLRVDVLPQDAFVKLKIEAENQTRGFNMSLMLV